MEIVLHQDVVEFTKHAKPLYDADPYRHTVALTVLDTASGLGDPLATMLTVHEGGETVAAALRSPGFPLLASGVPAELAVAVDAALAGSDPGINEVAGPEREASAFAAAHTARTGSSTQLVLHLRLFKLGTLVAPTGIRGAARLGTEADLDVLGAWRAEFDAEASHRTPDTVSSRERARSALRLGSAEVLWEVDGLPVSLASARRPVAGMSRVGPVYTPPELRGHGYAAAATAAASQWALDAGAERVVLFTDLANPTTNRLYPRLGYQPVYDALELRFESS
ncbi:GNAT family N-acetyltransferase [Pseudonocardia sp. TRM90224]|uniref:GNAT family N-acetyltransferase n=1 Tax=Pseudonocardia sp. TRM90224 TaxID=2812678 RepID=UPI001E5842A4|nr:GNAT family N-acetyltransferase [Pseudonocardia sp. TRM90224]